MILSAAIPISKLLKLRLIPGFIEMILVALKFSNRGSGDSVIALLMSILLLEK